jgi:hypothetical protein
MIARRHLLPVLAGLGVAVAMAAPAHSGLLITTRSGTECVKLGDTTPDILYNGLGAYNDATASVNYACPVNAHYMSLNTGYYFDTAYWWVHVDDNNGGANVSCFLSSCSDTGVCTNSISKSSAGIANNQILSTVGTTFTIGSYTNALVLRCSVPAKVGGARSGIRKYTLYGFD